MKKFAVFFTVLITAVICCVLFLINVDVCVSGEVEFEDILIGTSELSEENDICNHNNFNRLVTGNDEYIFLPYRNSVYKFDGKAAWRLTTDETDINQVMLRDDKVFYSAEYLKYMNLDGTEPGNTFYTTNNYWMYNGSIYTEKKDFSKDTDTSVFYIRDHISNKVDNYIKYTSITPKGKFVWGFINNSDRCHLYYNDDIIGEPGMAAHSDGILISDKYIFYLVSSAGLSEENCYIYRFDTPPYDNPKYKKLFDTTADNISFINYDKNNVYILNENNNRYYSVNQETMEMKELLVSHIPDTGEEIFDGWLYRLITDTPVRINIETGEEQSLADIFNNATPDPYYDDTAFFVNLNGLTSFPYSDTNDECMYYIQNGERLYSDIYNDSIPENSEFRLDLVKVYSKDYYSPDSTGYDSLTGNEYVFKSNSKLSIAPIKVTYKNYEMDNAQPKKEWVDYFEKQLQGDTPVVIKESWSFEYNGHIVDCVTATNITTYFKESEVCTDIPAGDNLCAYRFTEIFADGVSLNKKIHFSTIGASTQPLNNGGDTTREKVGFSFVKPSDTYGDANYGRAEFYCYQKDNNGNIGVYAFYDNWTTGDSPQNMIKYNSEFGVADSDCDGEPELIHRKNGHGSFYMYTTDWEFECEGNKIEIK